MTAPTAPAPATPTNPSQRIFPLRTFCQRNAGISEASIRWNIYKSKAGRSEESRLFRGVFLKRGGRIFIDEHAYFEWLRSGNHEMEVPNGR